MTLQRVAGFTPSRNGFHFANAFDKAPVLTIRVPFLGEIPIGNAAGGLCGGMVFAVCDFFQSGLTPPGDSTPPRPGTPLFRYLAHRLIDSFNGVPGVLKYLRWMRLPSEQRLGLGKTIAWHTLHQEWPGIRADLDNSRLCPLGLIEVESTNPLEVGKNHQVLAYGYDLNENNGDLTIFVYDPNCPDADDVTLALNVADADQPSRVTFSADPAGRGFFRTVYTAADPRAALATA
jgi:hypothetical protein